MDAIKNLRVTFTTEGSEFVLITSARDFSELLLKLRIDTVKFLNSQNASVTGYLSFEEIRDWNIEVIDPQPSTNAIQVTSWRA